MKFIPLAAAALGSVAVAQAQPINGSESDSGLGAIIAALESANLTTLSSATQSLANSSEGMAVLGALGGSNKTLFAPSNEAFAALGDSPALSNQTLLSQIIR